MAFFHSSFMLQSSHEDEQNLPSTSLAPLLSPCAPQEFPVGVSSQFWKRSISFPARTELCGEMTQNNHGEDELSDDDGSQLGEKKRRLSVEQVKTLEKNFELGTKLEPERKMRLARDLGLQPRQVAIWFQNRRARWKTKQLEKDYDLLKRQLKAAKAENDALQAQNQRLHAEILALKNRETIESINLNKETEGSSSNRSENSSEVKLEISRNPCIESSVTAAQPGLFPSSSVMRHNVIEQLFHNTPRPEMHADSKMDQGVKEESSFCNMLCGVDDQTPFWPWMEHHNLSSLFSCLC